MPKSRFIIIFAAFIISVFLFSCQWQHGATPAGSTEPIDGVQKQTVSASVYTATPVELFENVNGRTADEVSALFSSEGFEFNNKLYQSNEIINADIYSQSLQNSDEAMYILQLSGQASLNWQYIVFQGNAETAAYKGSISLPGNRTAGNDFRIIEDPISGTAWMVIRELIGYGTGVSQYNEVWYRISDRLIVQDLHYIVEMHEWVSPSQMVFYSVDGAASTQHHVNISRPGSVEFTVEIQYHFNFSDSSALSMADEGDAFLFSADRKIRYVWKSDEKRFQIDTDPSYSALSLFDFSKLAIRNNFKPELEKLAKSDLQVKKDWLDRLQELDLTNLKGPEVADNLNTIEIMNLNDTANATAVLSLPEGFSIKKLTFPKAPNFEYHAEKNKVIDTVYSFEIYNTAQKDKFRLYGTEGLAGWFYDTSYYRNKPEASRFPTHAAVKSKVYEGDMVIGKGEIFVLDCEIISRELKTEDVSTYQLIFAWIPIENEDLAYNLAIRVPDGEENKKYVEMVKTILKAQ